jgi:hypothetical protein
MIETAQTYLDAGLSVLPAIGAQKRPAVAEWKSYQQRRPTAAEVRAWFSNGHSALCLVCGQVSGNLEMLDFDAGGELYEPWREAVREAAPGLLERLVIEATPSGGRHVAYRNQVAVCGNLKLAQRRIETPSDEPVTIGGKKHVPRKDGDGRWHVLLTLIETRGEGGLFLCAPSPGYGLLQGDFTNLPVLTAEERDILLSAAWALNEYVPAPEPIPAGCSNLARPGDDYAARGDVRAVLAKHGWTLVRAGENEYWRRPGKTAGWSATLKDRVFYVFSSSAAPFEPNKAYSPFAVYAHLEHNGDFAAAARALRAEGYGGDDPAVDLTGIVGVADAAPPAEPSVPDPGPMPDDLLEVPGFIRQVTDYTLSVSPYPQPVLAFAAALTLQAFLAGRKVRDAADNRTNLYVLALANSGAGKNEPRKVNQRICVEVGLQDCLGDAFASGEGIEDRLFITPSVLFQTDEIDGLMNAINKASDARHEGIMNVLLKMYTSSSSIHPMRVKAGGQSPGVIDQPSLCMLGTAVPKYYYEALNVRMLNNGFFARLIILEAGKRGRGQTPVARPIPQAILDAARWWADYRPGTGNLQDWHPIPVCVEATPEADTAMEQCRAYADDRYAEAEEKDDPAAMAIWARAYEKARKLALVHAVSANHLQPRIDERAVQWAWRFVDYQTRRMLFMAGQHVAEGEFDAKCKRMLEVLTSWRQRRGDAWMPHWELSRRLKWSDKDIEEVRNALRGQRRIEHDVGSTAGGGPVAQRYRLLVPNGVEELPQLPHENVATGGASETVADQTAGSPHEPMRELEGA